MLQRLKRAWLEKRLTDPRFLNLFDEAPGEWVSLDCEASSLNPQQAELLSIGAVRLCDNRVLTSQSFYVLVRPEHGPSEETIKIHGLRPSEVAQGLSPQEALTCLLDFIGGRPLVGYYLEYDLAVLEKYLKPMIGIGLPNRAIELSGRYYDYKFKQHPGAYIDLRLDHLLHDLCVPPLPRHNALNDAITVAMAYLVLRGRGFG